LIISTVLKHVMPSAAEAEIGSVFLNAKEATILRTILKEMGHPQPPTPLQTDITTSTGCSYEIIKERRTCYGHAVLSGQRQSQTRSVPCLLGPRIPKIGRLLHKTSFTNASQKNSTSVYTRDCKTDEPIGNSRFRIARVC
jgi:hypothetical protein